MSTPAIPLITSIGHKGIEGEFFVSTDVSDLVFETDYKRPTHTATQYERLEFSNRAEFGKQLILKIPRLAELIGGLWFVVDLPGFDKIHRKASELAVNMGKTFIGPYFEWCQNIEYALIDNVELWIGGVFIERQSGLYMFIESQYEQIPSPNITQSSRQKRQRLIIPLRFWFCKSTPTSSSHALPIGIMYEDEVEIRIQLRSLTQLTYTSAVFNSENPASTTYKSAMTVAGGIGTMLQVLGAPFYVTPGSLDIYGLNGRATTAIPGDIITTDSFPLDIRLENAHIIAEYVFLGTEETQQLRSYPIERAFPSIERHVIYADPGARFIESPLPIKNPFSDIWWTFQNTTAIATKNAWLRTDKWPISLSGELRSTDFEGTSPLITTQLLLNSRIRFNDTADFFRYETPAPYFERLPVTPHIYYYSFRRSSETRFPDGLLHLELIENKIFQCELNGISRRGDNIEEFPGGQLNIFAKTWRKYIIYNGKFSALF